MFQGIKPEFFTLWSPEMVALMGERGKGGRSTPDAQNQNLWKSGPHTVVAIG